MPRYTREEFEAGEKQYHVEKSVRALSGIESHKESLYNIENDFDALIAFEKTVAELPESQKHLLEDLTNQVMSNYLSKELMKTI